MSTNFETDKFRITINLREGITDIPADAILETANQNEELGDGKLISMKMGRWMEVECEAEFDVFNLCEKLLVNNVTEEYKVERIED